MTTKSVSYVMLLLAFLCIQHRKLGLCNGASISSCRKSERDVLLDFKEGLKDPTNRLSSWTGEDCCNWEGIACNNKTGHVVRLDLRNPHPLSDYDDSVPHNRWSLGGMLNPSLLGLKHLNYLDLSMNDFGGICIPEFIGSLSNLRYLNLSRAGLGGLIPHQLGNLSRLQYLDLYNRVVSIEVPKFIIDDAMWIPGLSSLQHLSMSDVEFQNVANWVEALNMLHSIVEIHLSGCDLNAIPLSLPHVNFTHLSVLDLSSNSVNSSMIPLWLFNISSLSYIDLRRNSFRGSIPAAIGNLTSLNVLDLSSNQFSGYLPDQLVELRMLTSLHLSNNHLSGTVPTSLGCLSNLVTLDIDMNRLRGIIFEAHFTNLSRLEHLYLSTKSLMTLNFPQTNNLVLKVSPNWVPPFQLKSVGMSSCALGPQFPPWLRTQTNLSYLDISNNGILGTLPDWLWKLFSFSYSLNNIIDMSRNGIIGKLPDLSGFSIDCLDLSSNYFKGHLPNLSSTMWSLNLSNNSFSGLIHPDIGERAPNLTSLSLSKNKLSGVIPLSLCKLEYLNTLDLSRNFLSGKLHECWNKSSKWISILDFADNNLSGGIPYIFGSIASLESLHLSGNSLSGELPFSLRGCTSLITLDLGQNKFTGRIPNWIAKNFPDLRILRLRSNMFAGEIPSNLSRLRGLQILDLGNNNLSGTIPQSLGNIAAMKSTRLSIDSVLPYIDSNFLENIEAMIDGSEREYTEFISLVTIIDISDNRLSGEIPREIGNLSGLVSLNLSGNNLIGELPEQVGLLYSLEFIDLSRNELSGTIPSSMSSLTFLSYLNLSYNNLTGEIPSGNQFHTFGNQSYIGNPGLCGFPLSRLCHNVTKHSPVDEVEDLGSDIWCLYVSMVLGFVIGFWVVFGALLIKKKWKNAYFRHVDYIYDRIYVAIAVNLNRLK